MVCDGLSDEEKHESRKLFFTMVENVYKDFKTSKKTDQKSPFAPGKLLENMVALNGLILH